jgi:hypothetical protein
MVVLGGGDVSYERGAPVPTRPAPYSVCGSCCPLFDFPFLGFPELICTTIFETVRFMTCTLLKSQEDTKTESGKGDSNYRKRTTHVSPHRTALRSTLQDAEIWLTPRLGRPLTQ